MQLIGWYLAILRFLLSTNEYYLYTVIVLINIFNKKKIQFSISIHFSKYFFSFVICSYFLPVI